MAKEERRISPALAIIPVGLGIAALVGFAALSWAAPPVFTCPYCGADFATEEELSAHIELEHPELPPLAGDFVYTDQQCSFRPFPGATAWRQPLYSVTITNQGSVPGTRIITLHVRATEDGDPWPGSWQGSWEQYLAAGQSVTITAREIWPVGTFSTEFDGIPFPFGQTSICYMHIEDDAGGATPECSIG